jgi:outer membrane murein-binding lipoprotein Lpp
MNSFYMHPKYQEFLCAIKNLESDARVNPNALNLAFDVWLLAGGTMGESKEQWLKAENERLTKENEQLMKDVHRIDSARQAAVNQCAAMAERIEELESIVCGGAIGERGDACMSVDGGNL